MIGGRTVLLHEAPGLAHQRRESRIVRRRALPGHPDQHRPQGRLKGRGLRRFGAVGERHGGLKQVGANRRRGGRPRREAAGHPGEHQNEADGMSHGVVKYHSCPTDRVGPPAEGPS